MVQFDRSKPGILNIRTIIRVVYHSWYIMLYQSSDKAERSQSILCEGEEIPTDYTEGACRP